MKHRSHATVTLRHAVSALLACFGFVAIALSSDCDGCPQGAECIGAPPDCRLGYVMCNSDGTRTCITEGLDAACDAGTD